MVTVRYRYSKYPFGFFAAFFSNLYRYIDDSFVFSSSKIQSNSKQSSDERDIVFGRSTMQLIIYFSGFEMSTGLSVAVAWFPALKIKKNGTANKNQNYHKVLAVSAFFIYIYKISSSVAVSVLVDLRPHTHNRNFHA